MMGKTIKELEDALVDIGSLIELNDDELCWEVVENNRVQNALLLCYALIPEVLKTNKVKEEPFYAD